MKKTQKASNFLLILLLLLVATGLTWYFVTANKSDVSEEMQNDGTSVVRKNSPVKQTTPQQTAGIFDGTYGFVEVSLGLSGTNMTLGYILKIKKEADTRDYVGTLNIDGHLTMQRINVHGIMSATHMSFYVLSFNDISSDKLYKPGDHLFDLDLSDKNKMKITWDKMKPGFLNTDINNSYFARTAPVSQ